MNELLRDWKLDCYNVKYECLKKDSKPFFRKDRQGRIRKLMWRGVIWLVELPPSISAYKKRNISPPKIYDKNRGGKVVADRDITEDNSLLFSFESIKATKVK